MADTVSGPAPVFIGYSQKDPECLDDLAASLSVLKRRGLISPWSDQDLGPGAKWQEGIFEAIANAKLAILLVTRDFLDSDFINNEELPRLKARHEHRELTVFPIHAKSCYFEGHPWLKELQFRPPGPAPVWSGHPSDANDEALRELTKEIFELANTLGCRPPETPSTIPPPSPGSRPSAPYGPDPFVNRIVEEQDAISAVNCGQSVGITGIPGIGKTCLATRVFNDLKDQYPDRHAWYEVKEQGADVLLDRIAEDFGARLPQGLSSSAQKAAFRASLSSRPALIGLDDVRDRQVLYEILDTAPLNLHFIITAVDKRLPERVKRIDLEVLSPEDTDLLFARIARVDMDNAKVADQVRTLCSLLGSLPKAVDLLATFAWESRMPIGQIVDQIWRERHRWFDHDGKAILSAFSVVYRALDESNKELFLAVSTIATDFDCEAATALSGLPDVCWRLPELLACSFLRLAALGGRYTIGHDLLRDFAQEQLRSDPHTNIETLQRKQVHYFLDFAVRHRNPPDELDRERENVLASLEWCVQQAEQEFHEDLFGFIARLFDDDAERAGWAVYLAARLYKRSGEQERAREFYQRCMSFASRNNLPQLHAASLRNLGEIHLHFLDTPDLGRRFLETALKTLEGLSGMEACKERLFVVNVLLDHYLACDDRTTLQSWLDRAHEIRDSVPHEEWSAAEGFYHMAPVQIELYEREQDFERAQALFEKERAYLEGVDLAAALGHLGCTLLGRGDEEAAHRHFDEAFNVYRERGNVGGCAWINRCRGEAARLRGVWSECVQHFAESFQWRQKDRETDRTTEALLDLVDARLQAGDRREADRDWRYFQEVLKGSLESCCNLGKRRAAQALKEFGRILLERGEDSIAVQALDASAVLFDIIDDFCGEAEVLWLSADYWAGKRCWDDATSRYDRVMSCLKRADDPELSRQAQKRIYRRCREAGREDIGQRYREGSTRSEF